MILNTSCSLLSKVGSIHLYIDFFGWYSFLMIAGVLILNIAFSYLCQLISTKKYFKRLKMVHERDLPEGKSTTHLQKLFTSYTNLFVLSRTFGSIRKISTSLFRIMQTLIGLQVCLQRYCQGQNKNYILRHFRKNSDFFHLIENVPYRQCLQFNVQYGDQIKRDKIKSGIFHIWVWTPPRSEK